MKILLINGSPVSKGVIDGCLNLIEYSFEGEKVIRINIPNDIIGCSNCRACKKCSKCNDEFIENFVVEAKTADALIFGSPVYYGGITSQMKAFITKVFYSHPHCLEHKVVATFVSSRRAGSLMALSEFNAFFFMHSCILIGSTYWNEVYGDTMIEAVEDSEGMQTLRNLATNVKYTAKALKDVEFPPINKIRHLNFIARKE